MIIKTHVLLICLILIAASSNSELRDFKLSLWKNYDLNSPHLVISHSNSPSCIEFIDRIQKEWKGTYQIAEEVIHFQFKKSSSSLEVIGSGDDLIVKGLIEGEKLALSYINTEQMEIVLKRNGEMMKKQLNLQEKVTVIDFDELIIRAKKTNFGNNFEDQKNRIINESEKKLTQFLSLYKINETYKQFGKSMLSRTFSQLCTQTHDELSFIGICYNIHQGKRHQQFYKIDIRYSALIIDRLFATFPKTALFLFEDLIGLLQDQIFYSDLDFIEIPQHISIVRGFVTATKGEASIINKRLHERVKQVLNGLMNQMLLAEVNTLQEQINYRQNKMLHPTLVKMVSLKWHSHSRKNTLSSIYQESFTPDYFYNHANQRIDSCVSKVAWLTAATAEFVVLIKSTGNQDDIDALEQSTSLFRILQQVSGSDSHAKQGRFYSINTAEGVRVYAQQVGYESFLPYTYELTSIFPQEFLKNVTTPYGLASLNLNHDKFSSKFEFRGNIHLYFNYKILFQARRRLQQKNPRALPAIQDLITKIRQKITNFWQQGRAFSSWTISGNGLRERQGLSLLALLMMGEKR